MRGHAFGPHALGGQRHLELDSQAAAFPVRSIVEIGQWRGIPRSTRRHRLAERRKGLRADHPWADAGQEILGEEGAERLIFPRLDVARGPVIEQAIARDVIPGLADRDGTAELIAAPDPDAELELVIEAAAGTVIGCVGIWRLALPVRTGDRLARRADGTRPAMIANRHIFVV